MGRKTANSILTALLLICLATLLLLCAFGVVSSKELFFDGWWVIFIIIPMLYSIVNSFFGKNILSVISSVIFAGDIIFFFVAKFVLGWTWGKTLAVFGAVLIISLALKVIISPFVHRNKKKKRAESRSENGGTYYAEWTSEDGSGKSGDEVHFSAKDFNYDGRDFTGTELEVAFGASKLDLSTANIMPGAEIKLDVSFGGVEVILPDGVGVENRCSAFCGGVNIKSGLEPVAGCPTVILTGKCSFGGIEVRKSNR